MSTRMVYATLLLLCVLPCTASSCGGAGGLLGMLGPTVKVVIQNDTAFTAVPDIRTSNSGSFAEDLLAESHHVTSFGIGGTVAPNETVTFFLPCDGDLELIHFRGAEFRGGGSLGLGEADANVKLRRDRDFDCGDTVRIQLRGDAFSFRSDVGVDRAASDNNNNNNNGNDLADLLDGLFN